MTIRPDLQALHELTHRLLVAAACAELSECEELSRRRDAAIAALVRTRFTSFARPAERSALEAIARASDQIERLLAARLQGVSADLGALRAARAALPGRPRRTRSHGRV